jgi:hypothetical protein
MEHLLHCVNLFNVSTDAQDTYTHNIHSRLDAYKRKNFKSYQEERRRQALLDQKKYYIILKYQINFFLLKFIIF